MSVENNGSNTIQAHSANQYERGTNKLLVAAFSITGVAVALVFVSMFTSLVQGRGYYGPEFFERIHIASWTVNAGAALFLATWIIFGPIILYRWHHTPRVSFS